MIRRIIATLRRSTSQPSAPQQAPTPEATRDGASARGVPATAPDAAAPGVRKLAVPNTGDGVLPEGDTLLVDISQAWVLEEGAVDLFVVEHDRGKPLAWERLFQVEAGAMYGGVAAHDQHGIVARVAPRSRLRTLQLDSISGDEDGACAAVDEWLTAVLGALRSRLERGDIHALDRRIRRRDRRDRLRPLALGDQAELDARDLARLCEGVGWVEVQRGAVRVIGRERSRVLTAHEFAPLGDADWLLVERDARVRIHATADVAVRGALPAGLAALGDEVILLTSSRLQRTEKRERDRIQERGARDRQTVDDVVQDFAAILDQRVTQLRGLAKGPAYAAAELVGHHLGVEIAGPATSAEHGPKTDIISQIAHASRMRTRQVELAGRWWRRDYGPLIGATRDGATPVALIPGRTGYRLYDPSTGRPRRIGTDEAAGLETVAREFYRPLPEKPLTARDILGFGMRGLQRDVTVLLLCALLVAALGLLVPIMTGIILGKLVPQAQTGQIAALCTLLLVAAVVSAMINAVFNLAGLRIEGHLDHKVQAAVWDRLLALPAAFFRTYSTGELATAALGVSETREQVTGLGFKAVLALVVVVADLLLIAALDVRLLLTSLVIVSLGVGASVAAGRRQLAEQRAVYELDKEVNSRTFQLLSGVAKISTAAAESRAFAHWAQAFARSRQRTFNARAGVNRLSAFNAAFTLIGAGAAFFVSGALIDVGRSTFLIYNVAFFQVLASLLQVSAAMGLAVQAVPALEGLRPIMDSTPERTAVLEDPGLLTGAIQLDRVSFSYTEAGPPALDGVSFSVRPGEFLAIVGPSGSGKSTLVRLLLGFDAPQQGSILYDDQDLSNLDPIGVRRQFGVVLQDAQLFAGDILTNVIGGGLYTHDDAWEAIKMCGMDEVVSEMPMGMYTMMSDAGAGLSGGQLQRLLLARALVTRPRILILDEATSGLDNRTQEHVMQGMQALDACRIVIAHRLSTIHHADRIIVLEAGRVVQEGTYDALMSEEGLFRTLARRQVE